MWGSQSRTGSNDGNDDIGQERGEEFRRTGRRHFMFFAEFQSQFSGSGMGMGEFSG